MKSFALIPASVTAIAALALAGCSEEPEVDTSYESELPAPVPQGDSASEPVPDNTSITGGPDEQVDAMASGDEVPVEGENED
ncbi:hypothetical protein [Altererythrobacter sp. MTPC7]|uniref:hypothetical protein n=1 Tax=Altererythrobacter sp. MTPC7 TaxID=3056567 RepID=UPI0036F44B0B